MYFEIIAGKNSNVDNRTILVKLNKTDIEYLLKEKSIAEFDYSNKIRIELE